MSLSDPVLATWAAVQIYSKTITQEDESDEHILLTVESKHPYRPNEHIVQAIHIPYAQKLIVHFEHFAVDSSDSLIFYEDEECSSTRVAKDNKNKMPLSFS